jgi:hypothetical protein
VAVWDVSASAPLRVESLDYPVYPGTKHILASAPRKHRSKLTDRDNMLAYQEIPAGRLIVRCVLCEGVMLIWYQWLQLSPFTDTFLGPKAHYAHVHVWIKVGPGSRYCHGANVVQDTETYS